jgi:chromosome partitioning protein
LSTNIAGWLARQGHAVMLGDVDRQQSARQWLGLRPAQLPAIHGWDVDAKKIARPPKGTTHVVLDTPAGMQGKMLQETMGLADKVIVPLQPSIFDIYATRAFLDELAQHRKAGRMQVGIVGTRVDARTIAADKQRDFVAKLGLPVLGFLRPTQNYVHLAARGLTLSDLSPAKVERDLEQWQGIWRWLDA